jgi:signal transduction histidine kinase
MDTIKPANASPSLRVLLVEDSADDAELLGFELADQGYSAELTRVDTPRALDEALDTTRWDVVLCDHRLPSMDALSALSSVQARGLDLPFIIISSVISESSAVDVMRAGAHDFLFKHRLGRLGAVIERELRESSLRAERRRMQEQLLLADRLTSVGMLAAGVAHEINNPLAYVLGNVDFALQQLEARGESESGELGEIVQALTQAREGSERIRHISRDLKVFCRGNDEDSKTPINVRQVMESSLRMAWNEIRHRSKLTRSFERVPSVLGNQSRLSQVFLNLLVNAGQALSEERVEHNEITVRIRSALGRVEIEVQDNGCGMTPEQRKRVFEPFFTTKPRGVGSGIGLSICAGIVGEMGGEIGVESRVGHGTTFRILLPACDAVMLTSQPPQAAPPRLPRSRILVVDDEPALCAVVRRLLQQHEVVICHDAREALSLLQRDAAFDVLICDVMMPSFSGIDLFAELQRLDPELAARTLFMTGGALHGRVRQFLSGLSNPVLEKPFETSALHAAIARLLEARPISGTWLTAEVERTG